MLPQGAGAWKPPHWISQAMEQAVASPKQVRVLPTHLQKFTNRIRKTVSRGQTRGHGWSQPSLRQHVVPAHPGGQGPGLWPETRGRGASPPPSPPPPPPPTHPPTHVILRPLPPPSWPPKRASRRAEGRLPSFFPDHVLERTGGRPPRRLRNSSPELAPLASGLSRFRNRRSNNVLENHSSRSASLLSPCPWGCGVPWPGALLLTP